MVVKSSEIRIPVLISIIMQAFRTDAAILVMSYKTFQGEQSDFFT